MRKNGIPYDSFFPLQITKHSIIDWIRFESIMIHREVWNLLDQDEHAPIRLNIISVDSNSLISRAKNPLVVPALHLHVLALKVQLKLAPP